jgi:retron-type reverse transcriptase
MQINQVEMPKLNGGRRRLRIPVGIDRLIQQTTVQMFKLFKEGDVI